MFDSFELNFLIKKLNEQSCQGTIRFQLEEVVANGIYANKDSAYKGLKKVLNKMMTISIESDNPVAKSRIVSAFMVSYSDCMVEFTPIIRENITLLLKLEREIEDA